MNNKQKNTGKQTKITK